MSKLKNALIVGGGVLLLGAIGTLTNSNIGAVHASDTGPIVTVGSPLPLPTTAAQNGAWNVGITGTPNVNVANTPGVNINNTPNVAVTNSQSQPVKTSSVDDPGRTPYQFVVSLQPCSGTACPVTTPAIPAGKRLVVQHVSGQGGLSIPSTNNQVEVIVSTSAGRLSAFVPQLVGNSGRLFAFDQTVQGYADAGDAVTVTIYTDGSFTGYSEDFVVTGYLIDCSVNQCSPIAP